MGSDRISPAEDGASPTRIPVDSRSGAQSMRNLSSDRPALGLRAPLESSDRDVIIMHQQQAPLSKGVAPAAARSAQNSNKVTVRHHYTITNPHLRRFRAFALGYIAFVNNRWETLEVGRLIANSDRSKSIGADIGGAGGGGKDGRSTSFRDKNPSSPGGLGHRPVPPDKPFWVSMPGGWVQRIWELLMIVPILYTASVTPFRVFFQEAKDVRSLLPMRSFRRPKTCVMLPQFIFRWPQVGSDTIMRGE